MINEIICGDCLDVMRDWHDDSVDLVLTDPPYGIGADVAQNNAALSRIKADGKSKAGRGWKLYEWTEWDKVRPEYNDFLLILRVGKNQVIWGGNYFADYLPPSQGWLVWNKGQRNFSLADGELAWTSYDKALRIFDYSRGKMLPTDDRKHPTQKPLALMKWCVERYTKPTDLIFDPFCGSGTTCVAAKMLGRR